jgi:hypothetical protein
MKILERILAVAIVVGLVLKFSLIAGGDFILLLAMMTLASIYFPIGFLFFNQIRLRDIFKNSSALKDMTAFKACFAIGTGVGLSTIIIGALFKLLNFTGANAMLVAGLSVTTIIVVVAIILSVKNNHANSKFILWRASVVGAVGVVLLFTSGLAIVKLQYRDHPAYIDAYTNYSNDPQNEELGKKVDLEHNRIKLTAEEFKRYEESMNDK